MEEVEPEKPEPERNKSFKDSKKSAFKKQPKNKGKKETAPVKLEEGESEGAENTVDEEGVCVCMCMCVYVWM